MLASARRQFPLRKGGLRRRRGGCHAREQRDDEMLMALALAPADAQPSRFVRQPPDGFATAVASPSPPLLRGNPADPRHRRRCLCGVAGPRFPSPFSRPKATKTCQDLQFRFPSSPPTIDPQWRRMPTVAVLCISTRFLAASGVITPFPGRPGSPAVEKGEISIES